MNLYEIVILAISLVGVYVKLQLDIAKLQSRVMGLENNTGELKQMLVQLTKDIHDIKLLLAKNQIEN
jgi:hypothetical protein